MSDQLRNSGVVAVALLLTIILCAATNVFPMRFDVKTFGELLPRNTIPNEINAHPERLWDVRDGEIARCSSKLFERIQSRLR